MATAGCIYLIWFLQILFTSGEAAGIAETKNPLPTLNITDFCMEPVDAGPCKDNVTRWSYDKESDRCSEFYYGGCKGNKNSFPTELACEQKCLKSNRDGAVCNLPKDAGTCKAYISQWFYDCKEGVCKQFVYGGCDGNGNRFDSREECEFRCGSVQGKPSICKHERQRPH